MFNRIKYYILFLITMIWFGIILPYFVLQTTWGAKYAGQLLSYLIPNYDISIGKVSHSIANPYQITFENIHIQDKDHPNNTINAKKLILGLNPDHLLQYQSFDYIDLEEAQVTIFTDQPDITSQHLNLINVSLNYEHSANQDKINLTNINGHITAWSSQSRKQQLNSHFNVTIEKMVYNDLQFESILIKGNQTDNQINILNFGANLAQAAITGKLIIKPDQSLIIEQLKVNNLNYQSDKEINYFTNLLANQPKISIKNLSILNSSLNIANLVIEKGNLEINNLNYNQGWQIEQSNLIFSAQNLIWYNEIIDNPLLQWHADHNQIIIDHGLGYWNKGIIAFSGILQNQILSIDSLIASGIYFEFPYNWYQSLNQASLINPLFSQIKIKQLTLMPSLIMSTDPILPFQFNAFEMFGKNISIQSNINALQLDGIVSMKAEYGSLNKVKLDKPDLILNLTSKCNQLTFSSLVEQGLLEGTGCLTSLNNIQSLTMTVHAINSKILSSWYIVNNPPDSNKFTIKLKGTLSPLKLSGEMETENYRLPIKNNQMVNY